MSTNNTSVYVQVANNRTVSWRLVYTSNVNGVSGTQSSCETTTITIQN